MTTAPAPSPLRYRVVVVVSGRTAQSGAPFKRARATAFTEAVRLRGTRPAAPPLWLSRVAMEDAARAGRASATVLGVLGLPGLIGAYGYDDGTVAALVLREEVRS